MPDTFRELSEVSWVKQMHLWSEAMRDAAGKIDCVQLRGHPYQSRLCSGYSWSKPSLSVLRQTFASLPEKNSLICSFSQSVI